MSNSESNTTLEGLESEIAMHGAMYHLREPAIRAAVQKLSLPRGSSGLDAGCGIGLITQFLAEAISPGGHVTGLDLSAQYLTYATSRIRDQGLQEQVSYHEGDVTQLPFEDGSFDWVWTMDTIWPGLREMGCPSDDPFWMVRELARVVRPGGTVVVLFWSSQKLLPGYPLLEARLNTTSLATAPFGSGMVPDQHVLRGPAWLRSAGLEDVRADTFVASVSAPLSDRIRDALMATFPMFWGGAEDEVSRVD